MVDVGAFYERGRFTERAKAANDALTRLVDRLDFDPIWAAPQGWDILDDFQLGPGEHGRLERLLAG